MIVGNHFVTNESSFKIERTIDAAISGTKVCNYCCGSRYIDDLSIVKYSMYFLGVYLNVTQEPIVPVAIKNFEYQAIKCGEEYLNLLIKVQ